MRNYTVKFVRNRLFTSRLNNAACPFPGRYPLRFLCVRGSEVLYHGKFHSGIWSQFYNNINSTIGMGYVIYDKAGAVLWGTSVRVPNLIGTTMCFRYFGTTFIRGEHLTNLNMRNVGSYRMYWNEALGGDSRRTLNTLNTISHIRTI